ncbi:type II secretion system inner membrane protein GspF [Desulfogranum japonicum]|uniref:type II secretion system inner membrane protein GspF n=1 Tax=Desulfogranum japonicum TaxID=231447 RepID=UPI00041B7269|nr:type II secretion system inner membrane protein GspF [Desulfogranum japonicum]
MPVFEYTALDSSGKKCKGILDADSLSAARQKIRSQGSYPVSIKQASTRKKQQGSILSRQIGRGVKHEEINIATRQLATLLGAGIPLIPSLDGLIQQTNNAVLKKSIAQIKDAVNEGNSLTAALEEHPRLFSSIYINMVRAGEASGSLDVVLEQLAEFNENQQALRSRIKAALTYPFIMAIICLLVLTGLLVFIVPSITSVFEESQHALPLPTIVLLAISDFVKQYWWLLTGMFIGSGIGLRAYIRHPKGKRKWDSLKLTSPPFNDLNQKIASARLGRTLSSLLTAGVPLTISLKIVRSIVNNVMLAETIDEASEELEKGHSLSQFFKGNRYLPPMLVQMIGVGEQSGSLDKMLAKAADAYEKEVESKILALTSLIEPIMILFMGIVVLFVVVSILLPIFEMNQLIK